MGTKTKRKESNLEHRQSVLLAKREELTGRLHARRSEIVAERESDDEAAIALQTVIRDFTYVSLENEIRTLAEVELSLRRMETGEYGLCRSCGEEIAVCPGHVFAWRAPEAGWTGTSGLAGKKDTTQTRTTQR